jgi:hypothetical protein
MSEQENNETLMKETQGTFITVPGQIYHIYRRSDGTLFVSMIKPEEWDMIRFKLEHVCPVVRSDDGTWEQAPVAQGIEQPPPKR